MRIFLFRGLLGDAFSTGMDRLADKLTNAGHTTSVHRWMNRRAVQRKYLEDPTSRGKPVAVIGHSLGANAAISMANAFAGRGLAVRYLATLDPTVRRTVADGISAADNFRSRDIRDKPIAGAREHLRNDLNHIQIDKDKAVHNHILSSCAEPTMIAQSQTGAETMANAVSKNLQNADASADALETALLALLGSGSDQTGQAANSELEAIVRLLLNEEAGTASPAANPSAQTAIAVDVHGVPDTPLTPVNAALGQGIGKVLDGRKTGIGIIGLLATIILPTLFPNATPIVDILQALGTGINSATEAAEGSKTLKEAPNLLSSIFAALTGWGVLGKIDKWVAQFTRRQV